jgi:hypothetical protein
VDLTSPAADLVNVARAVTRSGGEPLRTILLDFKTTVDNLVFFDKFDNDN